jgi:transcriptional regulator with XRE-family HTH domain
MGGVAIKRRKSAEQMLRDALNITGQPPAGWIRTMREVRGVSLRRLGERLGVAGNSVHVAERREVEGGISLYQLNRIAQALDCELRYTFVRKRAPRGAKAQPTGGK